MDRLQALSRAECLELLAGSSLGRVAFTERALPAIRPVNYGLVGSHIVLHTSGDGLGRRLDGQIVAFEVDDIDVGAGTGWSVVLTGTARLLRAPSEVAAEDDVSFVSLAGLDHASTVTITPGEITGRRVAAVAAEPQPA
jgi:nitroimidazol reductase NimA-like FMN-containing flavoprotein (pyridoxamine 5'-phosphate oxidase superfamily)